MSVIDKKLIKEHFGQDATLVRSHIRKKHKILESEKNSPRGIFIFWVTVFIIYVLIGILLVYISKILAWIYLITCMILFGWWIWKHPNAI